MTTIDKLAWLHVVDRRVLVARSRGRAFWYLPGGKRDPGESDVEALTREIAEELSVALVPTSLRFAHTFTARADGDAFDRRVRMSCYFAEYRGTITPAAEIEAVDWFGTADEDRCSPAGRQVLEWLQRQGLIQ